MGDGDVGDGGDAFEEIGTGNVKYAGDAAFVGSGAEHFRRRAQAEQDLDRANHEALASAGGASEAVQPRRQLDPSVADDR